MVFIKYVSIIATFLLLFSCNIYHFDKLMPYEPLEDVKLKLNGEYTRDIGPFNELEIKYDSDSFFLNSYRDHFVLYKDGSCYFFENLNANIKNLYFENAPNKVSTGQCRFSIQKDELILNVVEISGYGLVLRSWEIMEYRGKILNDSTIMIVQGDLVPNLVDNKIDVVSRPTILHFKETQKPDSNMWLSKWKK